MEIKKLLKPYNETHSIKEVVFALYFTQLVEDFTSWENLQAKMHLKSFDKLEKLSGIKYTFNSKDLDMKPEDSGRIGLVWKKSHDTSSIKQLLQLRNLDVQGQCILSFHELGYIRWANFKEEYLNILNDICSDKTISDIPVSALNLTYIDEFSWIDDSPIQLNKVFKETSSYLSEYFFRSHFPSIEIAAMINKEDSNEFLTERLLIDIQQTLPHTTIVITHTIASSLEKTQSLAEFYKNSIDEYLENTHTYNKTTLSNLLTDEVQSLIQLPKTL